MTGVKLRNVCIEAWHIILLYRIESRKLTRAIRRNFGLPFELESIFASNAPAIWLAQQQPISDGKCTRSNRGDSCISTDC